jgi:hypothetical protein
VRVYQFRHIRVPLEKRRYRTGPETGRSALGRASTPRGGDPRMGPGSGRAPLSSRGLGRRPLMAETRVRIPVAVLPEPRQSLRFLSFWDRIRAGNKLLRTLQHASHSPARAAIVEAEVRLPAHVAFETISALSRMPKGRRVGPAVVLEALERRRPPRCSPSSGRGWRARRCPVRRTDRRNRCQPRRRDSERRPASTPNLSCDGRRGQVH